MRSFRCSQRGSRTGSSRRTGGMLAHSDRQWRVFVGLPDATSLEAGHANVYAVKAIEELAAHGLSIRETHVLGSELLLGPSCTCERWASLVLFTNYLSRTSPVRCGTCFDPVALYRLPFTHDEEHLDVLQWAADYRACDTLQMHCTTGERFAEEQLARHDSSLSMQGREITRALSGLLKVPVYYYLLKSRGRSRGVELGRRCPSCTGSWRLDKPWHDISTSGAMHAAWFRTSRFRLRRVLVGLGWMSDQSRPWRSRHF